MIGGDEVYKVVTAVWPLYTAIFLGYASVKWFRMFRPDHCDAINRFNCYFILPFFAFEFIAKINPYRLHFRFLAADIVAKTILGVALVVWANFSKTGSFGWSITTFSLSSLSNALLIGVPMLQAMYGDEGSDLVVQSAVIQGLIWSICLLIMLEMRRADSSTCEPDSFSPTVTVIPEEDVEMGEAEKGRERVASAIATATADVSHGVAARESPTTFLAVMKIVGVKLAKNPNSYACIVGLIWALISKRWDVDIPNLVEGPILIMSKGGAGLAMFTMGLFIALQEKIIACDTRTTVYAMVLRFVIAPATTAVGAYAAGLHGDVFRMVVIQAALPPAVTSFVYQQAYGLHAQVLSTAIIFGTVLSLPLLIAYYALLNL